MSAMARVCGFVVFFLVLLRLAEGLIGPLPPLAAGVLSDQRHPAPDAGPPGFRHRGGAAGLGRAQRPLPDGGGDGGQRYLLRLYLPAKAVQAALSAGLAALLAPYLLP